MALPPTTSGVYEQTLKPNQQRYTISIPEEYNGEEAVPLILALHWGGPRYPFMGKDFLLGLVKPALEELGAIFVAPDCPEEDWVNLNSEKNILELLEFLETSYKLDTHQALITGYSLGGIGAWYLGARHQDRFAAALPISAMPPSKSAEIQWKIPLYVIHSRQDEIFPFSETESYVKHIKSQGSPVTLALLDGLPHFETVGFIDHLRAAVPWIEHTWKV